MSSTVFVVLYTHLYDDDMDQNEEDQVLAICVSLDIANNLALKFFDEKADPYDAIRCTKNKSGCLILQSQYEGEGMDHTTVWVEERPMHGGTTVTTASDAINEAADNAEIQRWEKEMKRTEKKWQE